MPERNKVTQLTVLASLAALVLLLFPLSLSGTNSGTARAARSAVQLKASVSAAHVSPLIGMWRKKKTCAELRRNLVKAGLGQYAPTPPCEDDQGAPWTGAIEHSHTFTRDGRFFSYDQHGNQVDDNHYRISNANTFVIGDNPVTVHFRVQGSTIRFYPVINVSDPCSGRCHADDLAWAISAFYPGDAWHRIRRSTTK